MSPTHPTSSVSLPDLVQQQLALQRIVRAHRDWFMTADGCSPLNVDQDEFEFSVEHNRLIFSCWTEAGSRTWRVINSKWSDDKLLLRVSRRMGAEIAAIELIPRASAKAIVANIAAARQQRCEMLAELVAQHLGVGGRVLGVDRNGVGDWVLGVDRNSVGDWVLGVEKGHDPHKKNRRVLKGHTDRDIENHIARHTTPDTRHPPGSHPKPNPLYPNARPSIRIESAKLSPGMRRDQPGRYARIILRLPHERVAVTGIVAQSDVRNVDALFSSALLWFQRVLESPKRPPIHRLLLVVERGILEAARQRHVLLRESFRDRIELLEIDDEWAEVTSVSRLERKNLWRRRLNRFLPLNQPQIGDCANEILAYTPHAIDVVAARHGQTLRFHGLPFARVRTVMNQDRIWFGIEGSRRRQLDTFHQQEWAKLFRDLETYRHENCRDRRHWFYRASGEAWLESILRRDITKLDPGLIIAPLHAQFRTSHGSAFGSKGGARPIDLLALRHDGRLVVIELKVTEDREHVFQGVDYWRRVEAHRRRGHIATAKLFGDREISDESPLVYLVAPALRFHPSFRTLARTIAPDIEIYRFDINEDWRSGVRVVRRDRVNA
jgi:hypothetical protein